MRLYTGNAHIYIEEEAVYIRVYMSTPRIEPRRFDKYNVVFVCKTDTNIIVMSNVEKFKLPTGF